MTTDFRFKIIHATRNGSLGGFGKEFRIQNHMRIKNEAKHVNFDDDSFKSTRRRRRFHDDDGGGGGGGRRGGKDISKSPFANHPITDIGSDNSRGAIPNDRINKMKKPISSSYANYKKQNAKKKFHLSKSIPRIYYNTREFQEGERGQSERRRNFL